MELIPESNKLGQLVVSSAILCAELVSWYTLVETSPAHKIVDETTSCPGLFDFGINSMRVKFKENSFFVLKT